VSVADAVIASSLIKFPTKGCLPIYAIINF
jgi:hypothetical protein